MKNINPIGQAIKVLPWGEEVYLEIPLHQRNSMDKFYARHGKTAEGQEYIEFVKFGPKPNTENKTYSQKFRLYAPAEFNTIVDVMKSDLAPSIGWDVEA